MAVPRPGPAMRRSIARARNGTEKNFAPAALQSGSQQIRPEVAHDGQTAGREDFQTGNAAF